jgi:Domain of unknown function (DUF222)
MPVLTDVTADLAAAVDAACAADPAALSDGDTIRALHRQLERLEAATTRAVAAFDAAGAWQADGARSAAAWLSVGCRVPIAACRRRVQLGRQLRCISAVEAAWLSGDLGRAHVELLAAARTPATIEVFARDEATLVDLGRDLPYRQFRRAVAYWEQMADADGVEKDATAQHESRHVHLSQTFDGMWVLDGSLDPIDGAAVATALQRIEQELFDADWADARARVGEHATSAHLARTPAQRRADALVEMARRAGAVPADARLPEPLFTVLVGYETFAGRICELANGTVVTPGGVARWLDEAWIERVVFAGPDRVKNVGHRRRLFTGATRRAVEVRDLECFHEFCDVPADQCQIDHVQPYADGGPTIDTNGRAACGFHNRRRHRRR